MRSLLLLRELELVNIEANNLRQTAYDLNIPLKQLQAICAALAKDLSSLDDTDQGGF